MDGIWKLSKQVYFVSSFKNEVLLYHIFILVKRTEVKNFLWLKVGHLRLHVISIYDKQIQPNILSVVIIIANYWVLLCCQVSELGTPINLEMTIVKANIFKILVIDKAQENFLLRIFKFDFLISLFSASLSFKMIPVVNESFCVVFI